MIKRKMIILTGFFILSIGAAYSQSDWNPYRENEFIDSKKRQTRSYVRGSKLEMGEIISIKGNKTWVISEGNLSSGKKTEIRVGDKIYMGSLLTTDAQTVVEVLLGFNARLRISPGTVVRMANISIDEKMDMSLTNRKLILEKGAIRARVKQNTVTPTPVLVISVAAEMSVGLPELAVEGGVDVVVERDKKQKEAVVKVLNGSIKIERRSGMMSKKNATFLQKGKLQPIVPEGKPLPEPEKMDDTEIYKAMKEFAFTTESWGQVSAPPSGKDNELDGP